MAEDRRVKAENIDALMADGKVFFLDVREPKEIKELGSYEGYVNIPLTQLEKRLGGGRKVTGTVSGAAHGLDCSS